MSETHLKLREKHLIGPDTRERFVTARTCAALTRHGISMAGISDARAPFAFTRPLSRISQILVCVSGWGEVLMDGEWVRCGSGTAYLTPPGVLHAYRAPKDGSVWRFAWVVYPHGAGGRTDIEPAPLVGEKRPRLVTANPHPITLTLRGLYDEAMSDTADPAILSDWASLLHAQARRIAHPTADEDIRLRRLWADVTADPAHPWTVDDLADRAGMSGEQLRRLCLRELGRSPIRQVTYLRMRHAASLLASEYYTVEAVAESVGYQNPFAFSTAFKRSMGLAPSAFRDDRRSSR